MQYRLQAEKLEPTNVVELLTCFSRARLRVNQCRRTGRMVVKTEEIVKMRTLLIPAAVSLVAILLSADARAITFLQPASGQTLYVGTQYLFVADLAGAASATATATQSGENLVNLVCSVSQGLAICKDTPLAATSLTVTISASGQTPQTLTFQVQQPSGVYPKGDKMLVGSYNGFDAANTSIVYNNFAATGQNSTQVYDTSTNGSNQETYVSQAASAGIAGPMASLTDDYCVGTLPGNSASLSNCQAHVFSYLLPDKSNFAFWEIDGPEYSTQVNPVNGGQNPFSVLQQVYSYIHANDSRPLLAYIDSGISAKNPSGSTIIQPFVPNVDLVGAGAYEIYYKQPPILVRWMVEQEISAIKQMSATIGPKYAAPNNQKTPVLINEAACYSNGCTTPEEYVHDVFAGLSAGAQGVFTYQYYASAQLITGLPGTQGAIAYVTGLLNGSPGVGEWILKGLHQSDVQVTVNTTPTTTPPLSDPNSTTYPSVRAAAFDWAGTRIVIAVNSISTPATATMAGLPAGGLSVQVLGEPRTAPISAAGVLVDNFLPYSVHIYQVPLVTLNGNTWTTSH